MNNPSLPHQTAASRLRCLIRRKSGDPVVLMEAHNGLSARLAEEAGFEAVWASGLAMSAALGVRDNNEASWTQVVEVAEFMADACGVPVLLDGDTGYGNFNNVRRLVRKLERRGIAGVCLEDKLFPKTNSFLNGENQPLADRDEFCGKLRAACDARADHDFVVVARTEAFIACGGLADALARSTAYAEAGADAILVHSRKPDGSEIFEFMRSWQSPVPVIIAPTMCPSVPVRDFSAAGIHHLIFANQALRSVITALQKNLAMLRQTLDLASLENEIAGVGEIFRLQNVQELLAAEARYLPAAHLTPTTSAASGPLQP